MGKILVEDTEIILVFSDNLLMLLALWFCNIMIAFVASGKRTHSHGSLHARTLTKQDKDEVNTDTRS